MQQQPESNQLMRDARVATNLIHLVASAHATCITMFIRQGFGQNMPGLSGLTALILLVFVTAHTNDPAMLHFMQAWFVILIYQRARTALLVRRGVREHSYYDGWPWFAMWFGFKSETRAKKFEPFLCVIAGALLALVSPNLGKFVMSGAISLTIVLSMQLEAARRAVVAVQDMEIEQRALSERLRGMRDDF